MSSSSSVTPSSLAMRDSESIAFSSEEIESLSYHFIRISSFLPISSSSVSSSKLTDYGFEAFEKQFEESRSSIPFELSSISASDYLGHQLSALAVQSFQSLNPAHTDAIYENHSPFISSSASIIDSQRSLLLSSLHVYLGVLHSLPSIPSSSSIADLEVAIVCSRRPGAIIQLLGFSIRFPASPSIPQAYYSVPFIHPSYTGYGIATELLKRSIAKEGAGVQVSAIAINDSKQPFSSLFRNITPSFIKDPLTSSPSGLSVYPLASLVNAKFNGKGAKAAREKIVQYSSIIDFFTFKSYFSKVSSPLYPLFLLSCVIAFASIYFSIYSHSITSILSFVSLIAALFIAVFGFILYHFCQLVLSSVLFRTADPYGYYQVATLRRYFLSKFPAGEFSWTLFPFLKKFSVSQLTTFNPATIEEVLRNAAQTHERSITHQQFRKFPGLDGILFMDGPVHTRHHKVYSKVLAAANRTAHKTIIKNHIDSYINNNATFPLFKPSFSYPSTKTLNGGVMEVSSFDMDFLILATQVFLDVYFGANEMIRCWQQAPEIMNELFNGLLSYDSHAFDPKSLELAWTAVKTSVKKLNDNINIKADEGSLLAEFEKESPTVQDEYLKELVHGWAAHKAIYVTMSLTIAEVAWHPHIQAALRKEIDQNNKTGGDNDTYMRAVLEETMRVYPISRYIARRFTQPHTIHYDEKGLRSLPSSSSYSVTLGYGTEVAILPSVANHDVPFWRNALGSVEPYRFEPDRWIHLDAYRDTSIAQNDAAAGAAAAEGAVANAYEANGKKLSASEFIRLPNATYAHVPFLAGRRQCLGRVLAVRTFVAVLTPLLSKYLLLPAKGYTRPESLKYRFYPVFTAPIAVRLVPRS